MAFSHGAIAKLFANGYDLSAFLQEVRIAGSTEPVDTTALGQTTVPFTKAFIGGPFESDLNADGMFDGATTVPAIDKILHDALGLVGGSVLSYLPVGDVFGSYGYGMLGDQAKYDVVAAAQQVVKSNAQFHSSSGLERAVIALALATKSTTANGTSIDQLASSANGGVGYLQVTGFTGTGGTIKIQHSTDNVTFPDLVTFAASTTISAQRVAVTGTVNRYIRAQWTIGGSSSLTVQVMFCRK